MRSSIAAFSLTCLLVVPAALAQGVPRSTPNGALPNMAPPTPNPGVGGPAAASSVTGRVYSADSALPAPTPPDQLKPATLPLPTDPIGPYLLTREVGPFMVIAKTFRGPEAERLALALVLELRHEYGLPAYILRTKDFPMRSMIRNVPPTAPGFVRRPQLTEPEKVRTFDEAAVLVGNEKSLAGSEALLHKVRKIKPKCLDQIPTPFGWRSGLASALRTTNPFVPTQDIFPGKKRDDLVQRMNSGPKSVYQCPGRYTLQVAEFGGRSVYNPTKNDPKITDGWLNQSPLRTAADDAERLADKLSRDPEVQRTGSQVYVYHDRTSSKVMMGAFNAPNDPAAVALHDSLLRLAVPLSDKARVGTMIAPGNVLTDLENPDQPIKSR